MKKEIFGYKSFEDLFNQYFEDLMRFVYGCVLIRKKVYGVGARRDGWSRPLPLGAPRPMIF